MDEDLHRQWEEKEQFPPYEFALEQGKEMFSKPFKNGKSYADCFPNKGIGIRQNYPYFDEKAGKVITLELALNRAARPMASRRISYVKDEMAALTAYMAFTSRGKPFDIKIPDDPRALEAYENGKEYFYTAARPAQFLLRELPCAEPGRAHSRRGAGARRSASSTRCRSTARNGAAWARPAVASSPATARSAACRSSPQDD